MNAQVSLSAGEKSLRSFTLIMKKLVKAENQLKHNGFGNKLLIPK